MSLLITGRVWKFGDNINTDDMHPSFGREEPWEKRKRLIWTTSSSMAGQTTTILAGWTGMNVVV